jgi:hypothetical protein
MDIAELIPKKEFQIFPIDPDVSKGIQADMKNAYDQAHPIVIWRGKNWIVDGYTRYQVALKLKIKDVPVIEKSFANEQEAIEYIWHSQLNRRNLTDPVFFMVVEKFDQRRPKGGKRVKGQKSNFENSKIDTREILSRQTGQCKDKISWVRAIIDYDETSGNRVHWKSNQVLKREKTIHAVYQEIRREKAQEKLPLSKDKDFSTMIGMIDRVNTRLEKWMRGNPDNFSIQDDKKTIILLERIEDLLDRLGYRIVKGEKS